MKRHFPRYVSFCKTLFKSRSDSDTFEQNLEKACEQEINLGLKALQAAQCHQQSHTELVLSLLCIFCAFLCHLIYYIVSHLHHEGHEICSHPLQQSHRILLLQWWDRQQRWRREEQVTAPASVFKFHCDTRNFPSFPLIQGTIRSSRQRTEHNLSSTKWNMICCEDVTKWLWNLLFAIYCEIFLWWQGLNDTHKLSYPLTDFSE